jgi:hypothetical protein
MNNLAHPKTVIPNTSTITSIPPNKTFFLISLYLAFKVRMTFRFFWQATPA